MYPKDICKAFVGKLRCWRRYKANPSSARKLKYQRCTQTYKQLVTEHEKNCETRVLDADNIGTFYKFVNKRLGNKTGISPLYDESGKLILDDCGKANLLIIIFPLSEQSIMEYYLLLIHHHFVHESFNRLCSQKQMLLLPYVN